MKKHGATYGCEALFWAPIITEPDNALPTYGVGIDIGGTASINDTISTKDGELYTDNSPSETATLFNGGDVTAAVNTMPINNAALIYGGTVVNGELCLGDGSNLPLGGLAGMRNILRNGIKYWQGYFYPKVKTKYSNTAITTGGNSISFSTDPLAFKLYEAANDEHKIMSPEYTKKAECLAWCKSKLGMLATTEFKVNSSGTGRFCLFDATAEAIIATGNDIIVETSKLANSYLLFSVQPDGVFGNGVDYTSGASASTKSPNYTFEIPISASGIPESALAGGVVIVF